MRKRVNLSDISIRGAIVLLMLYCYSRFSWGFVIPSVGWGAILALSCALSLIYIFYNQKIKPDFNVICCIWMTAIIILNRNYDISQSQNSLMGYISSLAFPITCASCAYIAFSLKYKWVELFQNIILIGGTFYAGITILCVFIPSIYYNIFLPLLKTHYSSIYGYMAANPRAGFSADYGMSSMFMTMGITVSLIRAYINYKDKVKNKIYWFITFMIAIAMLCNGKRSTVFALVIGFIVVYLMYEDKKDRFFRIILIFAIVIALALAASLYVPSLSSFFDRLAMLTSGTEPDVVDSRSNLWGTAYKAFLESPILGKGWRWFRYNNPIFGTRDVHNTYLQLLTENGLLGATPFIVFFVVSYIRALRLVLMCKRFKEKIQNSDVKTILFCLFLQTYSLCYMSTTTCFYSGNFTIIYFITCAATASMYYRYKQVCKNKELIDERRYQTYE